MSDKLFKNDLTPSMCQSHGNSGRTVACATISPSSSHTLHNFMTPLSWSKAPHWRNAWGNGVVGKPMVSHACAVPIIFGMLGKKAAHECPTHAPELIVVGMPRDKIALLSGLAPCLVPLVRVLSPLESQCVRTLKVLPEIKHYSGRNSPLQAANLNPYQQN